MNGPGPNESPGRGDDARAVNPASPEVGDADDVGNVPNASVPDAGDVGTLSPRGDGGGARGPLRLDFDAARRLTSALLGSEDGGDEGVRGDVEAAATAATAAAATGAEAAVADPLPRVPGYHLERRLGGGGGGSVYRAFRDGSMQPVALKLLDRPLGTDPASRRAWRELDALSQVRSPALPRVVDFGEHAGRLFVATELVDGHHLDEHCRVHQLARRGRVELLARVADAVQSLHEHGLIHRDLKPANVMVTAGGEPVVIDFGIASLLESDPMETITIDGAPVGTPAFMAPEQARGQRDRISTRTDVYGLGATAYRVLLGEPPHAGEDSLHAAIRRAADEPARPPRALDPSLPRPLAAILAAAVAPSPEDRYASASELAADLRRWLRGDPVLAQERGSRLARINRWMRRHPLLMAGSGGFAAAAVVSATLFGLLDRARASLPAGLVVADGGVALVRADDAVLWRRPGTWRESPVRLERGSRAANRSYLVRRDGGRDALVVLDDRGRLVHEEVTRLRSPYAAAMGDPLEAGARTYLVTVEDLLPEVPGAELLLVLLHPGSFETRIEVRGTDGRTVHRAWWHPGLVPEGSIIVHRDEAGRPMIVAAGIANRLTRQGVVLPATADATTTRVVFALRPEAPSGTLPVWLVPEAEIEAGAGPRDRGGGHGDGDGDGAGPRGGAGATTAPRTTPEWYRWLAAAPEVQPGPPQLRSSYLDGAAVHVDYPASGSIHLALDGDVVAVVWPDDVAAPDFVAEDVRRLDPAAAVAPGAE